MPHVLILEDEPSIAESLIFVLQQESFTTHWVSLAGDALTYARQHSVDLIIMDVGLPDMTGFEACKQLRRFSEVPVIFLTARGDELDRVVGLEIGADDYVVKPFSPRELAARVKAILRRNPSPTASPHQLQVQSNTATATTEKLTVPGQAFQVDSTRKVIYFYQQALTLTRLEFHLLQTLVEQPGRVFTRDELLTATGTSADAGYDRSIDGHIKTLRAKLRDLNPALRDLKPELEPIKTLRGFGYAYQPENLPERPSLNLLGQ